MRFLAKDEKWKTILKIRAWPSVCNIAKPDWVMWTKWPLSNMTWSWPVYSYALFKWVAL